MGTGRNHRRGVRGDRMDLDNGPDRGVLMKAQTIEVDFQYMPPTPVMLTIGDVSFPIRDGLAMIYRMAKYMDAVDLFMKEMQPYYWKSYQAALRLKQVEEERKRAIAEQAAEQRRALDAEKSHMKRLRKKNSTVCQDSAELLKRA